MARLLLQRLCLVRDVIAFNLGQDGIKRSSEDSAFYPNAPDCRINRVGQQYRHHNALVVCTVLFLAVPFWCRLSLANAGLGNAESADTAVCSVANADFANSAVCWPTLGKVACMHCWPTLSPAWQTRGNFTCLPCCNVACWRQWPMLSPARPSRDNVACQEWQHQARPPLRR